MNYLLLLVVFAGQSTRAEPNEPNIHRPIIPDFFLIRQEWTKEEFGLTPSERNSVEDEAGVIVTDPPTQWRTRLPKTAALNQKHAKRLYELSLWESGEFAIANSSVADTLKLSAQQRNQVDYILRDYYGWYEAEIRRLNEIEEGNKNAPQGFRMNSHPIKRPDGIVVLKQTMPARSALRKVLNSNQSQRLVQLKGKPPHTSVPFGFPFNIRPLPQVPWGVNSNFTLNPRVQEELGFTMKQSREWKERVAANNGRQEEVNRAHLASLDAPQLRRLRELKIQVWGARAILFQDIRTELGVAPDAMDTFYIKMHEHYLENSANENKFQAMYSKSLRENREDRDGRQELETRNKDMRREYQRALDAAAEQALTPEQRVRLATMKGQIVPNLLPSWVDR